MDLLLNNLVQQKWFSLFPIHLIINLLQNTDNNYLNKEKNELIIKEILEFKNWNTFNFLHLKDYLLQRYSLPNDYIFQNASNKQINIINEILTYMLFIIK